MGGFDELIERLLYDVALSGSQGFDAIRFEKAVLAFYEEKNTNQHVDIHVPERSLLFADRPPVQRIAVDSKLLSSVLEWLCRHPDVEVRRVNPEDDLDIAGRKFLNDCATPEIAQQLHDQRIFTTEDRIWRAIAGHGPDFRRIPPFEFDILSIIAAHSSTGVLQPTITRMTGQDKRSVPKRTDNLQAKGYITKETVIASTGKTSLLKLSRFSKIQSLEKPPEESAINNLKPVIHYDKMYNTMMRMLQENSGIVTMADLRLGLGIQVAQRWETKILARCVRRLAEGGCIRRVTAKMADRQGEVITRIGHPIWRKAKAIQLMRQPTEYDRLLWEQSDPKKKARASDDEDEGQADATLGDLEAPSSNDEDDAELVEIGTIKEIGTTAQQIQALKKQVVETENADDEDSNDLDRLADRVAPHWTPNVPLVNLLFNQIDNFGEAGISSTQLQSAVIGPLWKRPMDESLAHLTDIWQHSQPPHLRHLTIVRDTAVFGRSAQFKYRTLANFEKAVAAGKAVWAAVLDNTSAKAKKNPLQEKPELDRWGFPKVPAKFLQSRNGRASLLDGRRGIQVERVLAVDADADELVVEDDDDAVLPSLRPTTGRGKTTTKSKRGRPSTNETPRPAARSQKKENASPDGTSARRRKRNLPSRSAIASEVSPQAGRVVSEPRRPHSVRQRVRSLISPDEEALEVTANTIGMADNERQKDITEEPQLRITGSSPTTRQRSKVELQSLSAQDTGLSAPVAGEPKPQSRQGIQTSHLRRNGSLQSPEDTAKSKRNTQAYIPYHKPRQIKEKEYTEYDEFAQRTAENLVRLELSRLRKRSASDAFGDSRPRAAKKQRLRTDDMRNTPSMIRDATTHTVPIHVDQLPPERVSKLKAEILEREKPGLYINPPGAKSMKADSFISRGRPRNAKIAVIRTARLHELEWFDDEDGPRYAPPRPLGRRRTAVVGKALQISDEINQNTDSDEGEHLAKRPRLGDAPTPGTTDFANDCESASGSDDDSHIGSRVTSDQRFKLANGISLAARARKDTCGAATEQEVTGTGANGELIDDGSHNSTSLPEQSSMLVFNGDAGTKNQPGAIRDPRGDEVEAPKSALETWSGTDEPPIRGEDLALKPPSRTNTTDTTSFYLSRFAPEHRATPQQQYRLLSAKPGRKSKRDLEVLAELEQVIGPQTAEPLLQHKLMPTEVPDRAESTAFHLGQQVARAQPVPQKLFSESGELHKGAGPSTEAVPRATQSPDTAISDASKIESRDHSNLTHPVADSALTTSFMSTSGADLAKELRQASQALAPRTPESQRLSRETGSSNEYFSTAYVDAHPDETFYHAGAGRWKRGMPPANSRHRTFRGPGAQELLSRQRSKRSKTAHDVSLQQSGNSPVAADRSERITMCSQTDVQPTSTGTTSPENIPVWATPSNSAGSKDVAAAHTFTSSLLIVRPYEEHPALPRNTSTTTNTSETRTAISKSGQPLQHAPEWADDSMGVKDVQEGYENGVPDGAFEDIQATENGIDVDISEQPDIEMSEVGPTRVLKTTTKKKYGPPRLGSSTQLQRYELILNAVHACGGVFPGDSEIWYVLTTAWRKIHNRLPDKHTVERAVEQLMTEKKLKRFRFQFKSKHSAVITKQILAEAHISADDPKVAELRKQMLKCYPLQYLPEEVEIDEELRETASYKFGRKRAQNGEIKLSQNTATYLKRRYEEFPEDPELVVHQTADAAARADREAQSRGFPNAQALRKHLQEMHIEMKNKANQKQAEKRRKEHREADLEDAEIAADIAAEEAELLGDAAGQIQLENYQHDFSAAMQPRPAGARANISREIKFDNVLPRAKAARPVRKTRRPLGSIRAPAPKSAPRVWWEDERRLRNATAAHLMSPAQTFSSSSGTFSTSGQGIKRQVVNRRAAAGTLSREQYQEETARVMAQLKQSDRRMFDGRVLPVYEADGLDLTAFPATAVITLKVPKDKLDAIVSSEPNPIALPSFDDDDASVFDPAATPSSLEMTPEPEPEPEPPRKRRKYASRKKRQTDEYGDAHDSDDDFVPAVATDNVDDRPAGKPPKLKGPGARGIKKAFTTRDRQSHLDFKDVDRLVVAIALVSAIAGGVNQDKLSWNLIAHALSFRYDGEFLRRRWGHYMRSRKADVEQLRDDIRQPFLEAYEQGELPIVDFQASHETDWPALFAWVQATVPMHMSIAVDEHPDVPDFPASRHLVEHKFAIEERGQLFELNKDDYFTTITDQNRRHLAQRFTFGTLLPGDIKPSEHTDKNLLLAKSWVRAVAMTKQHKYVPEAAARKISVLGNKVLKQVATEMVEAKMFLQDKKGRHQPGRNFQIHHEVLIQFRRWPATKETDEHRYLCALAHSWTRINDYFKQTDALPLVPITSDQDYTILTNLCATGMLRLDVLLPETKQEFDAPPPKLSPWGYSGTNYQTKRANQDQLKFDLVYVRTPDYKFEPELKTDVPIPLEAPVRDGELGPRIPFWADIHGGLIDDIWDMCLRSVLHLIVFRSGERAVTMQQAHNHKLWQWEIELILHWMEESGLARRCGAGEEVDGVWTGGWTASDWWFCAFLPEMITWEPPLQGGFIEVS